MITTLLRISWTALSRDRVAQVITMVVPIFFFSIFALIFGGRSTDRTVEMSVAVVDEAASSASTRLIAALDADPSLSVQRQHEDGPLLDRAAARQLVADGTLPVAVVIPVNFEAAVSVPGGGPSPEAGEDSAIVLFADNADPVAPKVVGGLLQAAVFRALPELFMGQGPEVLESGGDPGTAPPQQDLAPVPENLATDDGPPAAAEDGPPAAADDGPPAAADDGSPAAAEDGLVRVVVDDVVGQDRKDPAIAFYAASTGVMFLLFTISASAGTLLDEEQMGVLERLLNSNLSMSKLLFGKWLYLSLQGIIQVSLMFIWGSLVFKLELWTPSHLLGFCVMTLTTATTASAFGLLLATACRTRAQLGGLTTILVLTMSMIGGSMFPRYLMPDWMQNVGLITFNAWALDGYQKVFWYDRPVFDLWPQVAVLTSLAVIFLLIARRLARRWEVI